MGLSIGKILSRGHPSPPGPGLLAQLACLLEVTARKPGNVHRYRDFDDATYLDFLLSAAAIAGASRRRSWTTALRTSGAIAAASSAAGATVGRIVGFRVRRFIVGVASSCGTICDAAGIPRPTRIPPSPASWKSGKPSKPRLRGS